MGPALLALLLLVAGAMLVSVHAAFAWLMPAGVAVFFLSNLMALKERWKEGGRFARELAAVRAGPHGAAVVVRNEFRDSNAQALWLDPESRELGLLSGKGDTPARSLDGLHKVRAVFAAESHAQSFHEGRIRIPARYVLVFEFIDSGRLELVTRKRRLMDQWIESLQPVLGRRLDWSALDGGS